MLLDYLFKVVNCKYWRSGEILDLVHTYSVKYVDIVVIYRAIFHNVRFARKGENSGHAGVTSFKKRIKRR